MTDTHLCAESPSDSSARRRSYRILGSLEVDVDGRAIDVGPPKQRAVLAALLVHANRVASVDSLIDQLWGEEAPARALGSLQAYVSNLRRLLEPGRRPRDPPQVLVTRAPGYVLRVEGDDLDAIRFERLATAGRDLLQRHGFGQALEVLNDALALWRGDALADFAFEGFSAAERTRLTELRAGVEEDRAEASLGMGHHLASVADLEQLASAAPFRERRWELLMVALYRCGRQADALRAFQAARATLAEELGIDPGPRLRQLEADVLAQSPALAWHQTEAAPGAPRVATASTDAVGFTAVEEEQRGLVGRSRELAELERDVLAGGGAVVLVSGEAGIGKTTIVEELARRAASKGFAVAWGRCLEIEGMPPLWPWTQVIDQLELKVPDEWHRALAWVDSPSPVPLPRSDTLAPSERSSFELFFAAAQLISEATRQRPTLVVIDDLHWADSSSLGLLRVLGDGVRGTNLAVVATFRETDASPELSDTLAALARAPGHRRLALRGFDVSEIAELVTITVGTAVAPHVAEQLRVRTEGNPFFLVELTKLLASEQRLGEEDVGTSVPVVVDDVVRSRIARLPTDTRALLTVAAVCGHHFDIAVVCGATGVDEDAALDFVEGAIATGLVTEGPDDAGRCRFSHALVREALYQDLSGMRRARLHRRVAEAIEHINTDNLDPHLDELAHHFGAALAAGTAEQAFSYRCRAAGDAASRSAHAEAAAHWAQALDLLQRLGAPSRGRRYDLLLQLGRAERLAGEAAASRLHLQEAAESAEEEGDVVRAAEAAVAGGSASVWNWTGTHVGNPDYIALLDRLASRLDEHPRLRALVLASLAGEHANLVGDRVGPAAATALSLAEEIGDPEARFAALNVSYVALQGTPDLASRMRLAEELVRAADGLAPDRGVVARLWRFVSRLQSARSDAEDDLEAAATLATRSRQPALQGFVTWNRAMLGLMRGPLGPAEAAVHAARDPLGFHHDWDGYTVQLFIVHWMGGRLPAVADAATESVGHHIPGMREAAAMTLASAGRIDDAQRVLCDGEVPRLPALVCDYTYAAALCARADAIALIGSPELAEACAPDLVPFTGQLAVVNAAACMGAIDFYRARLAATVGAHEASAAGFRDAVQLNERAGARMFAALSKLRLAEQLSTLGDADALTFRREAEAEAQRLEMRFDQT